MKIIITLIMLVAFYLMDRRMKWHCFAADEITAQAHDWKQSDIKRTQNNCYKAMTYPASWGE